MIIRKLRLEKGFSQEQLAQFAGISTRTLQRIERGANASPETLKCLASVLETDFAILWKDQQMPIQTEGAALNPAANAREVNKREVRKEVRRETEREAEKEAMEYVRDIKGFYAHLFTFAIIMTGLAGVNLLLIPGYPWVLWVLLGWGIGLLSHGLNVFELVNFFGPDWERRQIEKRMRRRQP